MVVCSHEHGDHGARECVDLSNKKEQPQNIMIEILNTFHDDKKGALRGLNNIAIISDGETRIAHFGDLGCDPTEEQKEQLKGLDAVLIPIGGHYTIDSGEAWNLVKELEPRIVIPMHFRKEGFGFDVISTCDTFKEMAGDVTELEGSTLDTNEVFSTQTVFLTPANS